MSRWHHDRVLVRGLWSAALLASLLAVPSCQDPPEGPARIVSASIERHGGDLFENSRIRFTFRGVRFEVLRDGGRFRHLRSYLDSEGRSVIEGMDNQGTWTEIDGARASLPDDERSRVEMAVNSVVYFALLPFRLEDPPVLLTDLGTMEVEGEPYHVIEVTFREAGGGESWEDRFVHWIHRDDGTLDYLAHAYLREGGGTRFRKAINRREIGGLLIQDYENFRAAEPLGELTEYPRVLEAGDLELLSLVELDDVEVVPADGATFDRQAPPSLLAEG